MYSRPTTPKTIGGVLDDIFKLYAAALPVCWPIALVSAVLSMVPAIYLALRLNDNPSPTAILSQLSSPTLWLSYLALLIVSLVFSIALIDRTLSVADGRESSFAQAIGRGFSMIPRAFLVSLLYGIAVLVGLVFLIIPGIFAMVAFCLVFSLIVAEDSPVLESFARSRALTKGDWWRTFATFSIALIAAYLLLLCVGFISGLVAGFATESVVSLIVRNVVNSLLNVVILPLYTSVLLGIYFDLKLRKEGDDLAARVAAVGAR